MTALATALAFLKRVPVAVYGAALFVLVAWAAITRTYDWLDARDAQHYASGKATVEQAAALVTRDYAARVQALQGELNTRKADANTAQQRAETRARSNAATDRLYASLPQLSVPAQADSTVQHLATAARHVADELDSTKADVRRVVATAQAERTASDAIIAQDSAEVHALGVVIVATQDTLATRTGERNNRVGKSKVAVIGSALLAGGVAIGRFVVRR